MNLSAHRHLAIKARLPEVVQVWVRYEADIVRLGYVWLDLSEDSRIVIYRTGGTDADDGSVSRCCRSRSLGDYSDRIFGAGSSSRPWILSSDCGWTERRKVDLSRTDLVATRGSCREGGGNSKAA